LITRLIAVLTSDDPLLDAFQMTVLILSVKLALQRAAFRPAALSLTLWIFVAGFLARAVKQ
jgi:hypothetical protein